MEILLGTAAAIGGLHTFIGVDHTLPFVALARAQNWSLRKVLAVTVACGAGHVFSSLLLGVVGIFLGGTLEHMQLIETRRGQLAAWLLIGFGVAYAAWSLCQRSGPLSPKRNVLSLHTDRQVESRHAQSFSRNRKSVVTAWSLFLIFVLGPCEPLVPLLMAPAFERDWVAVTAVVMVFGLVTLTTMSVLVALGYYGLNRTHPHFSERWVHTLCGVTIAATGGAISVLGI